MATTQAGSTATAKKQREANARRRQRQRNQRSRRYEFSIPFIGSLPRGSSSHRNSSRRNPSDTKKSQNSYSGLDGLKWPGNPLPKLYQTLKNFAVIVWDHLRWGGTGWHLSKVLSLLLLALSMLTIAWLHQSDNFFVYQEDVVFQNLTYVGSDELYAASQVEGWSVFWLDRDAIKEAITTHPYIADARVSIALPAKVSVNVTEQDPVALWVTDAGTLWLLEDGTALAARHGETQNLLHVLDGQAAARKISYEPTVSMNREVLDNARKLASYFPELTAVTFNSGFGLNFSAPSSGIWVYWGDGTHFETKLKNLITIENELSQGRIRGQLADLRVPEKPIVR